MFTIVWQTVKRSNYTCRSPQHFKTCAIDLNSLYILTSDINYSHLPNAYKKTVTSVSHLDRRGD
jgi:hypothetical protein